MRMQEELLILPLRIMIKHSRQLEHPSELVVKGAVFIAGLCLLSISL